MPIYFLLGLYSISLPLIHSNLLIFIAKMVRLDNSDLLRAIEESRQLLEALTARDFQPPGQMVQVREDQVGSLGD